MEAIHFIFVSNLPVIHSDFSDNFQLLLNVAF